MGWKLNGGLRMGFIAGEEPPAAELPPLDAAPALSQVTGGESVLGGPGANLGEAGGVP